MAVKNCEYPNCENCTYDDCVMEDNDIVAMLKRDKRQQNPELYRQKQRDYRKRIADNLPHCDECSNCILVKKDKGSGYRRLCVMELRLIEQKVSNSPLWCKRRSHEWLKRHKEYTLKKSV